MQRRLLALGFFLAVSGPAAIADKYTDSYAAARAEVNPLGDKALAGDAEALADLEALYAPCKTDFACSTGDPRRMKAAVAAANLGWLYWQKHIGGDTRKVYGLYMYAEAARLDSPAGYFQVGDCIRDGCVQAGDQQTAFAGLIDGLMVSRPWDGDLYAKLKAASFLLEKAAYRGLTDAAIAQAEVEFQLFVLAEGQFESWDDVTLERYNHLLRVSAAVKRGLDSQPTDAQRAKLDAMMDGAEAQLPVFEADAAAIRARRQAAASPESPPRPAAPSKGANYETDKARALSCIAEAEELQDWLRDLNDWKRDLNAWDKEIKENAMDLNRFYGGGSPSEVAAHNAEVDVYNAEGRDYSADKREHDRAAEAYEARCSGSYNGAVIDEVCTGSAAGSSFCKGLK